MKSIIFEISFEVSGGEFFTTYKKTLKLNPDYIFAYLGLTVCYIMLQREEDARGAAAEVIRINPKFSVTKWEILLPFKNKKIKRRELEALRKAGLK